MCSLVTILVYFLGLKDHRSSIYHINNPSDKLPPRPLNHQTGAGTSSGAPIGEVKNRKGYKEMIY